jgi:hypothetical protein
MPERRHIRPNPVPIIHTASPFPMLRMETIRLINHVRRKRRHGV